MKRFLQLTFTIAFVLCAMLSLSGCSSLQKILPDNMGTRHYWGDDDPWGEETILSKTADSVSFWRRFGLKSGKFVFTLANPRLISYMSDLPDEPVKNAGFTEATGFTFALPPDDPERTDHNTHKNIYYPDFVQEDGSFLDGAYLLLLDITVESQDAVNFTKMDKDEGGLPMGLYSDPYVFRTESIVNAGVAGDEQEDPVPCTFLFYYSGFGSCSENDLAFRVEPGESITFTIGFPISDIRHGGIFDLNKISLYSQNSAESRICRVEIADDGSVSFE